MTTTDQSDGCWDPDAVELAAGPYPVFRRLRDEAQLSSKEPHDFSALSRYGDVDRVRSWETLPVVVTS